jgi:hypothetical protein
VTAVTRESDRIIDIAIQHRGGTDFTPGSSVTGFEVLAGGQLLPIAAVARRDSSTIRIELEDAVAS